MRNMIVYSPKDGNVYWEEIALKGIIILGIAATMGLMFFGLHTGYDHQDRIDRERNRMEATQHEVMGKDRGNE